VSDFDDFKASIICSSLAFGELLFVIVARGTITYIQKVGT
jgi:hypothetical protein